MDAQSTHNGQSGATGGSVHPNCAAKITVALSEANIDRGKIDQLLNLDVSDLMIPLGIASFPVELDPGHCHRLERTQRQFLAAEFVVGPEAQWPGEHLSLMQDALHNDIPKTLEYSITIGRSSNTEVFKVKHSSGEYALKKIKRNDEHQHRKYVIGELNIMRKIHRSKFRHFIKLVASYTDLNYVGMLLSPAADYNLDEYMAYYDTKPNPHLLEGFFGCLAAALAYLHYIEKIRHKDIKPANILVHGNNVLLADFGIALDWAQLDRTTTNQEQFRSFDYCAPEVFKSQDRNSRSDIWSLGCVFLEMIAVLKGKPRIYVKETLESYGSPQFCNCRRGIEAIIADLKADNSKYGNNKPLDWSESMLKRRKEDRPNAKELRNMTLQAKCCGLCCTDNKIFRQDNSSNQGVLSDGPSIPTQVAGPPAITVKVLRGYDCNPRWCDAEAIEVPSLSQCWISQNIVLDSSLTLHDNAETEYSPSLDGKEFKSNKHVEITCMTENTKSTLIKKCYVATATMPFDMLVTSSVFNALNPA